YLMPDEPAFFVVDADFVSVEDGTGIVHTAAAYGVDDLELCLRKGIPVRHVVDLQGRFKSEVEPFAGIFVKKADPKIIDDLQTLVDWSLSRWRYWGTPLPVWVCETCDERRCVGSVAELGLTLQDDLHRPYIDRVTLPCTKCEGVMRRVADLIDVWFDSGSMP